MAINATLIDGKVVSNYTSEDNLSEKKTGSDSLNKDAFLEILVAEMQYQDPLEPSSNTEWVSQMASFSQIETLNDISGTINAVKDSVSDTSAANLVGKRVILNQIDEITGESSYVTGVVQSTQKESDGTYLSVNGYLYPINSLYSVVDEDYYQSLMKEAGSSKL